jgi:ATP synthase F1 complex assembly factor 1
MNKLWILKCSMKQTRASTVSSLLHPNTIMFNNNVLWTRQSRTMVFNKLTLPGPKSLDQIVKINLLEKENPEAIRTIWYKYHAATNDVIAHTLSTEQYRCLEYRGQQCPMFVLPLFRNIGFVNMVLQFQRDHVLFSSLREFQKIGEFATPHLTLSHFTEFSHSKNLVLMRGEVNTKEIDKGQAKEIVEIMYRFYLEDKLFHEFVEPFNKTPHTFSFEKLMYTIQLVRPPQITKSKLMEKFEGKYVNTKKYEDNKKNKKEE